MGVKWGPPLHSRPCHIAYGYASFILAGTHQVGRYGVRDNNSPRLFEGYVSWVSTAVLWAIEHY